MKFTPGSSREQTHEAATTLSVALTSVVETHLPSAEIVRSKVGPVTVEDVAEELFRYTPIGFRLKPMFSTSIYGRHKNHCPQNSGCRNWSPGLSRSSERPRLNIGMRSERRR